MNSNLSCHTLLFVPDTPLYNTNNDLYLNYETNHLNINIIIRYESKCTR